MADEFLKKINKAYAEHPLTMASILNRVQNRKGTLAGLTEADLSTDDETGITDQNHVGGVDAVIEIAEAMGVGKATQVLDVGTGLGGAIRVLGQRYGCSCVGVELTEVRYRAAIELTQLVNLDHLVTLIQGDFLAVKLPAGLFDLVLGQESFGHFHDKDRLFERCRDVLRPGGHLVLEQSILRRPVAGAPELAKVQALGDCRNGSLATLAEWTGWITRPGLEVITRLDLSSRFRQALDEKLTLAGQGRLGLVNATELLGWRLYAELADAGLLGFTRIVARK